MNTVQCHSQLSDHNVMIVLNSDSQLSESLKCHKSERLLFKCLLFSNVSPTKLALVDFNPPELYRLALLFFFIESSMILQASRAKQREVTPKDFCATLRSKAKTLQAATGRVATFEAVLEWCGRLAAEVPLQQN